MKYTISANFLLVLTFALSTNAAAGGQHGPGLHAASGPRLNPSDDRRQNVRQGPRTRARTSAVPEQDRHRLGKSVSISAQTMKFMVTDS